MRIPVLLFALLLSASLGWAQTTRPAGQHEVDKAEAQFDKSVPPPVLQPQSIDLAKSIPLAVDQTTKGILPKDLDQKLKRIEKLAKLLRSQIVR